MDAADARWVAIRRHEAPARPGARAAPPAPVLFLDEPTTGLDIQSRTALWDEVASLSRDQGVTVLLTTQYLEEADQLAERVGIINHGRDRGRGGPGSAEGRSRPPDRRGRPRGHHPARESRRGPGPLRRADPGHPERRAVRLDDGPETLAAIVRAFDEEGLVIANLDLHAPSLNDVFLAKTGRSVKGAAAEEAEAAEPRQEPAVEGAPA